MSDNEKPVYVISVPLDLGAEPLGADKGPEAFMERKIIDKLRHVGLDVREGGNIPAPNRSELDLGNPQIPYAQEIARVNDVLAGKVFQAIRADERPVVLGGDHSINLGAFAGAVSAYGKDRLGLIYLDAHGDMNTPETSVSHNIHGMHVASLMGFGPSELVNVYGVGSKLKTENLLHIGGSDFDEAEIELARRENLKCFTMLDMLSDGLRPLLQAIDELCARVGNVWVSLDLDVIDSVYAPGVGIPNHGGMTYREIAAITDYIGSTGKVVGCDIVEYNPTRDIDNKTAELGIELTAKLLGSNYSWYTNYMDRNTDQGSYMQASGDA